MTTVCLFSICFGMFGSDSFFGTADEMNPADFLQSYQLNEFCRKSDLTRNLREADQRSCNSGEYMTDTVAMLSWQYESLRKNFLLLLIIIFFAKVLGLLA